MKSEWRTNERLFLFLQNLGTVVIGVVPSLRTSCEGFQIEFLEDAATHHDEDSKRSCYKAQP
jgi:hypothetical protein